MNAQPSSGLLSVVVLQLIIGMLLPLLLYIGLKKLPSRLGHLIQSSIRDGVHKQVVRRNGHNRDVDQNYFPGSRNFSLIPSRSGFINLRNHGIKMGHNQLLVRN